MFWTFKSNIGYFGTLWLSNISETFYKKLVCPTQPVFNNWTG